MYGVTPCGNDGLRSDVRIDMTNDVPPLTNSTIDLMQSHVSVRSFTDDPVLPGAQVTLEFTIGHAATAPGDATGIAFTDRESRKLRQIPDAFLQKTGLE